MSLDNLRIFAEGTIKAAMATVYPSVPVKFENAKFKQPETTFAAFCVVDGASRLANIGTRKVDRHFGLVQFDACVPNDTGTSQANLIAEFGGNQFRDRKVTLLDGSVVTFKSPGLRPLGSQNGFYRVSCTVAYWRDEPLR